ncbi:hypothetical protein PanWU01x14_280450 [Parasponia andersonii]|uniref:Uncharacterized protein n=1 Tax=Parasponia andersonii TaxID=3476 RepID=A0A2P5B1L1_PARAD|nr:hypothetical protein PanWU01x14_280450 [Parasponia andersonii]
MSISTSSTSSSSSVGSNVAPNEFQHWEFNLTLSQGEVDGKFLWIPQSAVMSHLSPTDIGNLHLDKMVSIHLRCLNNSEWYEMQLKSVCPHISDLELSCWKDRITGEIEKTFFDDFPLRRHAKLGFFWERGFLFFQVLKLGMYIIIF